MKRIKDIISTTFERDYVLQFLDQFDQIIFNASINPKNFIFENLPAPMVEFIASFLTQNGKSPEALLDQSKNLRKEIAGLPVIVLTVPFVVDQQITTAVIAKAREITGTPVLIEFKVDKTLIGGAVVEGDGRVGEYSFRRYFEKRKEDQNGL